MKICDWCSEDFEPNVSYQIYCSAECRESATKEKVNERYQHKRRQKLAGKILSVYNATGLCSSCMVNDKVVDKALKELKGLIEYEKYE